MVMSVWKIIRLRGLIYGDEGLLKSIFRFLVDHPLREKRILYMVGDTLGHGTWNGIC